MAKKSKKKEDETKTSLSQYDIEKLIVTVSGCRYVRSHEDGSIAGDGFAIIG